jgi:hypothetical protein
MIIRIDARRLTDAEGLHTALSEAFGFPPTCGRNLDAVVDCLTYLDDPRAGMSRVHVHPGHVMLVVVDHADVAVKPQAAQVRVLMEVIAFVNWRRFERGQPPVLAVAAPR